MEKMTFIEEGSKSEPSAVSPILMLPKVYQQLLRRHKQCLMNPRVGCDTKISLSLQKLDSLNCPLSPDMYKYVCFCGPNL